MKFFTGLAIESEIKLKFLEIMNIFNEKLMLMIIRNANSACRRVINCLAADIMIFHWTDERSGDLILTNFIGDQRSHDENIKKHLMTANPISTVLEKLQDKLTNLNLASSDVHSIELNLQKSSLQTMNPSIAATDILSSIGVVRGATVPINCLVHQSKL